MLKVHHRRQCSYNLRYAENLALRFCSRAGYPWKSTEPSFALHDCDRVFTHCMVWNARSYANLFGRDSRRFDLQSLLRAAWNFLRSRRCCGLLSPRLPWRGSVSLGRPTGQLGHILWADDICAFAAHTEGGCPRTSRLGQVALPDLCRTITLGAPASRLAARLTRLKCSWPVSVITLASLLQTAIVFPLFSWSGLHLPSVGAEGDTLISFCRRM